MHNRFNLRNFIIVDKFTFIARISHINFVLFLQQIKLKLQRLRIKYNTMSR